jgi:predicted DNA binding protein/PAS domain-containing protein
VSERVERQANGVDPLVSTVLDTVDEPAAVCDPTGRLRRWNAAFADSLGPAGGLDEASFGDLVDCPSEPLARAAETGEKTSGTGSVSTDDEVTVTVRPVERDGSVTDLVTTVTYRDEPLTDDQALNEAVVAALDRDREATIGSHPGDIFPEAFTKRIEAHRRMVLETEQTRVVKEAVELDDEAVVHLTIAPYYGPDCDVQGTVSIARDITELEGRRDELETLTEIQKLVQESMGALTGATTAEAIRETVYDRVAESEFYKFAWIGQPDPADRKLDPKYSAGNPEGYLDDVTVKVDASEHGGGPGSEAYRTGEVQVVHDVATDPDFEPWREAALEHGFQSVAAIPLTHGSTTHGLLGVYADRPNAFSRRELAGFETLGEVVGFALSAAQYRRLLEADSVLQLEFEIRGETPFLAASSEHDCRFEIEHAVQTGDDQVVTYLTVEGADPTVGEAAARELADVERLRPLDSEEGPHYEMTVSNSAFQCLTEAGARGERCIVEEGIGHVHVEAPVDADVRRVVGAMSERFSTVSLVAKREERRTDTPWWHTHGDIGDQLTDRQRAVLKTAYFNGYYEWPRRTDSEALADSLDIASTTFLQHLRKGHQRILEAMFES